MYTDMLLIEKRTKSCINVNMNEKYTSNIPHDMYFKKNCKIHPTDQRKQVDRFYNSTII